jgi:general stress protein 26
MNSSLPLHFIKQKVYDLQTALFFNTSSSILKTPVSVVTISNVDEIGQIWFVTPKPVQYIHSFDKEFPAKLDFYKKGKRFFLKIQGKGFIVTEPEEINNIFFITENIKEQVRNNNAILIKLKIQNADYFEDEEKNAVSVVTDAQSFLNELRSQHLLRESIFWQATLNTTRKVFHNLNSFFGLIRHSIFAVSKETAGIK